MKYIQVYSKYRRLVQAAKQRIMFPNADTYWTYFALTVNKLGGVTRDIQVFYGADEVTLRKKAYDGILPPTAAGCQREVIDMGRGAFHFPRYVLRLSFENAPTKVIISFTFTSQILSRKMAPLSSIMVAVLLSFMSVRVTFYLHW